MTHDDPGRPVESFDEWQARRRYDAEQRGRPRREDTWGRPVLLLLYRAAVLVLLLYVAGVAYRVNAGLDALGQLAGTIAP